MEKINYQQIEETVYTEVLPNGLTVTLLPKNNFHKTYGLFTTKYGSIDNEFVPLGTNKKIEVPDGIAHFLEHKLFEKKEGDVFQKFGSMGAAANAFTSFTQTSYLFSSTSQVKENLKTLLDFVQEPYFTDKTVNKEKGIIAQEIQMYEDDPDWRLLFGLLENLYPKHPIRIDIAGTVDSIMDITPELLHTCYQTFYHPSNMTLFVVGKLEPEEMMTFIRENQAEKKFAEAKGIQRFFPEESVDEIKKFKSIEMPVNRPKSIVGVKGVGPTPQGKEAMIQKTAYDLLLRLLFGPTSSNYLRLYDEGIIDDSFSYEYNLERTFNFSAISSDAKNPELFSETIKGLLLNAADSTELTEKNLLLTKKRAIGQHLRSLNSLEYIANQYNQQVYGSTTLFDLVHIIESITLADIKKLAKEMMVEDHISIFHILAKGVNNE
ncbi:MAG: insulinase family protein [Pisciglobus halotolerans]|nr:insulinase family protein [Pisciglobus halotolerans]